METLDHIAELRVVGGDPALDFVNTVDGEPSFDHLRSYEDLVYWGHRIGTVSEKAARRLLREANARREEAEATHAHALERRDDLYEIFRAVALGEHPPARSITALRHAELEAFARARLVRRGNRYAWEWTDDTDLARVVWPVVHAATELLTSDRLGRVKLCAGCHWLFLDLSKNKSRRWCSMEECGTHEKVRRYLARRAARRGAT